MSLLRLQSPTLRLRFLACSRIRVTRHDGYEKLVDELFERELRSPPGLKFRINLKSAPEKDGPTLVHLETPLLPKYKRNHQGIQLATPNADISRRDPEKVVNSGISREQCALFVNFLLLPLCCCLIFLVFLKCLAKFTEPGCFVKLNDDFGLGKTILGSARWHHLKQNGYKTSFVRDGEPVVLTIHLVSAVPYALLLSTVVTPLIGILAGPQAFGELPPDVAPLLVIWLYAVMLLCLLLYRQILVLPCNSNYSELSKGKNADGTTSFFEFVRLIFASSWGPKNPEVSNPAPAPLSKQNQNIDNMFVEKDAAQLELSTKNNNQEKGPENE